MICRHCKKRKRNKARGLCGVCYSQPAIRTMYPFREQYVLRRATKEETEADLDRIIAEQMKRLPKWWHISEKRGNQPDGWGRKNRTD